MNIFSTQLGLALPVTAGTWYTIYTCPSGKLAIVKDIRGWNATGGDPRFFLALTIGGTRRQIALTRPAAQPDSAVTGAFIVMNAGDVLECKPVASDAASVVLASGYELTL